MQEEVNDKTVALVVLFYFLSFILTNAVYCIYTTFKHFYAVYCIL